MSQPLKQTSDLTLDQWLTKLESFHPSEIELGLDRIRAVGEQLGCLKPAPLVILVAGTNGKGTTSALIAALLKQQRMKVGVYSSPHIQRYNERVQINGTLISDDDLVRSFEQVEQHLGDQSLTYFEYGTLAALWHFQQAELDVCVLEIGLGGRLDAVNIVDADLSIVTSIGLDHQAWLGNTLDDIAYEKCGIARSGRYLVCGQPNPPTKAQAQAQALGAHWCGRGQQFDIVENEEGLELSFISSAGQLEWQLPTPHIPYHNVATAIQALALLDRLPSHEAVKDTVAQLSVAGRCQTIEVSTSLKLTLDVAHNPQAAKYLGQQIEQVDGIILAMLADKESLEVVQQLPQSERYYMCGLSDPRGLSEHALQDRLMPHLINKDIHYFSSVESALQQLCSQANPDTVASQQHWLVVGSFYTVEAALNWLAC